MNPENEIPWYVKEFSGLEFGDERLDNRFLQVVRQVEKCRLSDATKVAKYITTYSIIAWRLYALTHAGRLQSQISCESIVNANEWKALYVMVHKTNRLPKKPPTVEQFIRWTAQLGGFLGRARDGNPGIKAIWKGYQRLCDYTAIYNILKT